MPEKFLVSLVANSAIFVYLKKIGYYGKENG